MKISIATPSLRFDKHLALESNNRVFFSAKFGTGKSYFLREYFKEKESEYNLFCLSPVNYVVGANQDIFEWIKIDIAKEILSKYYVATAADPVNNNLLIQTYLYNNAGKLINQLATTLLAKAGEKLTGVNFLSDFKDQLEEFTMYRKEQEERNKSTNVQLAEFLDQSGYTKGSIFEDDLVTQVIRTAILQIKEETKRESVLIIDDLDRLDPEHIFRILNILSSHNTHFDANKFGFDKVVLVGDLKNIEHIYEYRYGPSCDFEGYMEKFYSYEPFGFTIKDAIVEFCAKSEIVENVDEDNKQVLSLFLQELVESGGLKIRNLYKIFNLKIEKTFPKLEYKTVRDSNLYRDYVNHNGPFLNNAVVEIDFNQFDFYKVIYILSLACGGREKLSRNLEFLETRNYAIEETYQPAICNCIALPYHIASTAHERDSRCFFDIQKASEGNVGFYHPQLDFIFGRGRIPLKWTYSSPYNEGHFFQLNSSVYAALKNEPNFKSHMKWELVVHRTNSIIRFASHRNFFENI